MGDQFDLGLRMDLGITDLAAPAGKAPISNHDVDG